MKAQQKKSKNLPWFIRRWYVPVITLLALLITVLTILSIPSWIWYMPLIALGATLLFFLFREARQKIPWKKISWGSSGAAAARKSRVSFDDVVLITVFVLVIILAPKVWDYVSKNGKNFFESKPKSAAASIAPSPVVTHISPETVPPPGKKRALINITLPTLPSFFRKQEVLKFGSNTLRKGTPYYFMRDKRDLYVDLVEDGTCVLTYTKYTNASVKWNATKTCINGTTTTQIDGNSFGNGGVYTLISDRDIVVKVGYE